MFIILSGVAGAGKDTIKNELISRNDNIESLPSYTSRPIRPGDVPGKTYNFITTEQFEKMIQNNELYEYSKHHNNYYGTSKKLLNDKIKSGKIIIKDIDVNGTEQLKKVLEKDIDLITIFLRVSKHELKKRLKERIDNPSEQEINLRLSRFEYEESKMNNYDYIIENLDVEKTIQEITNIINTKKCN